MSSPDSVWCCSPCYLLFLVGTPPAYTCCSMNAGYTAAVFSMALLYCHFPASLLPRCLEALRCAAGKDKVENEDLIKWGLPHDVW